MDLPTFILELVAKFSWPGTAVLIVWILRKPLGDLIPRIQRVRFSKLDISFRQMVRRVAQDVKPVLPSAGKQELEDPSLGRLLQIAEASPRAAVLEAWLETEVAVRDTAKRHELKLKERDLRRASVVIRQLQGAEIITRREAAALNDLRGLRNAAAHATDFELSTDAVLEYVRVASRLATVLRNK